MGRRKCTPKQLAALRRGRKIAHRRSKKTTKALLDKIIANSNRRAYQQSLKNHAMNPHFIIGKAPQ